MLAFKESFGARWIELTGAHERVFSPTRYTLGRIVARVAARAGLLRLRSASLTWLPAGRQPYSLKRSSFQGSASLL